MLLHRTTQGRNSQLVVRNGLWRGSMLRSFGRGRGCRLFGWCASISESQTQGRTPHPHDHDPLSRARPERRASKTGTKNNAPLPPPQHFERRLARQQSTQTQRKHQRQTSKTEARLVLDGELPDPSGPAGVLPPRREHPEPPRGLPGLRHLAGLAAGPGVLRPG